MSARIPVAQIDRDRQKWHPRRREAPSRCAELGRSIDEVGLIHPIVVRRVGEDLYQVIDGRQRFAVALEAGASEVFAEVTDDDERSAALKALVANATAEDLAPAELAWQLHLLEDEYGFTRGAVIRATGLDKGTVSGLVKFARLVSRESFEAVCATRSANSGIVTARLCRKHLRFVSNGKNEEAYNRLEFLAEAIAKEEDLTAAMQQLEREGGASRQAVVVVRHDVGEVTTSVTDAVLHRNGYSVRTSAHGETTFYTIENICLARLRWRRLTRSLLLWLRSLGRVQRPSRPL